MIVVCTVAAVMGVSAACQTTARGKAQTAGKALLAIGTAVFETCEQSKANQWLGPLSFGECDTARVSYKTAERAWELALAASKENKSTGTLLVPAVAFVLEGSDLLVISGVTIPEEAQGYLDLLKGGL